MSKLARQKSPQTYAQKVASKEANILRAAKTVFSEKGYAGLRMSGVARRAGVAEGTIYSYFSSKDDLIRALVGEYWTELTRDARAAIKDHDETFPKLRALAQFHIDGLIARYDYAELTITLGRQTGSAVSFTDEVRAFVRVFDEVFKTGQDRGEIDAAAQVWIARDMFYGSLEYSARTLILRGAETDPTQAVVDNLMQCLRARYSVQHRQAPRSAAAPETVLLRQEAVTAKLEALCVKLSQSTG